MDTKLPIPSIRLLKQLSRNIYSSFKVGLKEIVINSFDAMATRVDIQIDDENNSIVLSDNGIGMDDEDIFNYFLKAGSTTKTDLVKSKRPIIGYKGIGVFSLFFFADELIIKSKKTDCDSIMCTVDLKNLRNTEELDDSMDSVEILSWNTDYNQENNGTIIEIKKIESDAFETIWSTDSIVEDQTISRYLCEVLPICYSEEDKGLEHSSFLKEENGELKKWDFNILLNDIPIRRKTPYEYFEKNEILHEMYIKEFENNISENLSIRGILFGGIKKIKDNNVSGFLIRNNNIAIGSRKDNPFNMRSRVHMLQWVSGEILINGDINEIITTDRERLVEDNDIFQGLKDVAEDEINPFLSQLQVNLQRNKVKKDKIKEEEESQKFENSLNQFAVNKERDTTFKIKNFDETKEKLIVSFNDDEKVVEINKLNKTDEKFSKWTDKELFYSFLALLQNKVSNDGQDCCKRLVQEVQEEFDDFVSQKDKMKSAQNEFGF